MKYKHFFFDMDGTIAENKGIITKEMIDKLHSLGGDIIIVSGQDEENMAKQLKGLDCVLMSQAGNVSPLWKNRLSGADLTNIYAHIAKVKILYAEYLNPDRTDYIKMMGGQLNFSFMGQGASNEDKIKFDPDRKKRLEILKTVPLGSDTITVSVGGTSCFEYIKKGTGKGDNILRYIRANDWDRDQCVFFGDALFKGGNDESVIGIIDTVEIYNPKHLFDMLDKYKTHIIGFTAGTFDFLHAGHILMLKECKEQCDHLIVAIQPNPNIDQKEKHIPIETMEERLLKLEACKYVDEILIYNTQKELYDLVKQLIDTKKIDVRFVGEDHKGRPFTGDDLPIRLIWNSRTHNYSSSNIIDRIKNVYCKIK